MKRAVGTTINVPGAGVFVVDRLQRTFQMNVRVPLDGSTVSAEGKPFLTLHLRRVLPVERERLN